MTEGPHVWKALCIIQICETICTVHQNLHTVHLIVSKPTFSNYVFHVLESPKQPQMEDTFFMTASA